MKGENMEDTYVDITFQYIDGSIDELKTKDYEFDKLIKHIKEKGFVGSFEEEHTGYIYNLALVKCIY
jgi:hypothetical protein